jgi:hypothetical protein
MTPETIGLTVTTGFIAFLVAIFTGPVATLEFLSRPIVFLLHIVGLVAALYLLASAGVLLLEGWVDPLSNVDVTEASQRRRGGLVVLLVRYTPYVMLAVGALFAFVHANSVRDLDFR